MHLRFGTLATVLVAVLVAASCDDAALPSLPVTMLAVSDTSQQAPAGAAVPDPPRVRVLDAAGRPTAGIVVAFMVTQGSGTLTGDTAVTDADGYASLGSWTLGAVPGINRVMAAAGALEVTFTAAGLAGPPVSIEIVAGDGQPGLAGAAVATRPAVRVKDAGGHPVAGAIVIFAVTSGGGSVTGAIQSADSLGVATVGSWTLGGSGTNSLTATSSGLTATFTATAQAFVISVRSVTEQSSQYSDRLLVAVNVAGSTLPSAMTAVVGNRSTTLIYENPGFGAPYWHGQVDIAGLPAGNSQVTVTAVRGPDTVSATFPFVHDRVPLFDIASPAAEDVAAPDMDVAVQCTDDTATCSSVSVAVAGGPVLATGTTAIATTVSLAAYVGQTVRLQFDAQAGGKSSSIQRNVVVISSSKLSRIAVASGTVLDYDGNRLLHLDEHNIMWMRTAGVDQRIDSMTGPVRRGWITPAGTLFAVATTTDMASVIEWRGGPLLNHGPMNWYTFGASPLRYNNLAVRGGYAAWNAQPTPGSASSYIWRDLTAGTSATVAAVTDATGIDVTAGGDAFYSAYDLLDLYRFRNGSSGAITSNATFIRGAPQSDGTISVYARWPTATQGVPTYSLVIFDGTGESQLVPPTNGYVPVAGESFAVSNGWVAFLKPDGAGLQLWLRAPDGTLTQATSQYVSRLGGLGEDGSVVYFAASAPGGWHRVTPGGSPVALESPFGTPVRVSGAWYFLIGRSVFQVVP